MKKDNLVYIEDILKACNQIALYINNVKYEELLENQMMVDAIIRNIEVIGEAANKLDKDFRVQNPAFPFRSVITMRNKLIHNYNEIDFKVVWDTARLDIPELRKMCERLLQDH